MEEAFIRYLHFFGIILLSSMLVAENLLMKSELNRHEVQRLVRVDGLYGLGAMLTLLGGFLLWFSVGKPQEFYSVNPIFHAKLGLFLFVAVLSIYPTVFLLKNRSAENLKLPRLLLRLKRVELVLLTILPLLAVLMAKGVGLAG